MGLGAISATTLAEVGLAVSAAGAAATAVGSISQGNYQASVARNNAQIAKNNATYSTEAGESQSTAQGLKDASQISQLRVDQAANNVSPDSGSALAVTTSAKASSQIDQQQVLQNALLQAYGYNTTASNQTAQANQDQISGYEDAGAGLLSNAGAIGFKFSSLSNNSSSSSSSSSSGAISPDPGTDYSQGY